MANYVITGFPNVFVKTLKVLEVARKKIKKNI
jgi:hypothetical protein